MGIPAPRFKTLRRQRILNRIAPSVDSLAPLVLLLAPTGFQKTEAAAQWAVLARARGEADVFWVNTPEQDVDLLWSRIHEALVGEQPDPTVGRSTAQVQNDIQAALRRMTRRTIVVIDDYQNATSGAVDLALARLLELGSLLHLIVLSRRFSALDGPLVTTRVRTDIVESEELAFTLEETQEEAMQYGVGSQERVERLWSLSHGWPAIIRLTMQELSGGGSERDLARSISRFAHQHLELISSEDGQRAMLATVLFTNISLELISQILDKSQTESDAIMRELCELGLVQQTWWRDTTRYSCHEGLAASLAPLAQHEFDEETRSLGIRHAVDLGRDMPIEAVIQLLNLEEYDAASRVLEHNIVEVLESDGVLLKHLRRIPDDALREHAELIIVSILLESSEADASILRLERLHQWLRDTARVALLEGSPGRSFFVTATLVVAERRRGEDAEALRLAKGLEDRVRYAPLKELEMYRGEMPLFHVVLGLTGLSAGDLSFAESNYRRAFEAAEELGMTGQQITALNSLASIAMVAGDNSLVERYLLEGDHVRTETGASGPQLSWMTELMVRAHLANDRCEAATAQRILEPTYGLLQRYEQWPLLTIVDARGKLALEGPGAALELLQHRVSENTRGGLSVTSAFKSQLTILEIQLLLVCGNYPEAERLLEALDDDALNAVTVRMQLDLFQRHIAEAIARARKNEELPLPPRLRAENRVLLAAALWEANEQEAALDWFAQAGELVRSQKCIAVLGHAPYSTLRELSAASRDSGSIDLASEVEQLPAPMRTERYEQLTKTELSVLEVLVTGATQPRIGELLFIAENTVKFHIRNIYRKLRVSGRTEAIAQALQRRLVGGDADHSEATLG